MKIKKTSFPFKGDWLRVRVDQIIAKDGQELNYESVEFEFKGDITIVATDNIDDEVITVVQWRHLLNKVSMSLPGGLLPDSTHKYLLSHKMGDDLTEDHQRSEILSELQEETGYGEPKKLTYLGAYHISEAGSDRISHIVLAEKCTRLSDPVYESYEEIEVLKQKWEHVFNRVMQGGIGSLSSVSALFMYFYSKGLYPKVDHLDSNEEESTSEENKK